MDSRGALAELKSFQGSRKGAGDYQSQFQQELGVSDAQARSNDIRQQIRSTESALKGVGGSVAGRTRGLGVNEAQRARLVNLESQPIAQQLGERQGAFADEQQNYRDLLGQATTRAGQAYQSDADKLASLESNYGKLYQQEQAAAEAARWQQQQAEQARQWQSQFDESRRQFEAGLANTRNQYAQQASLFSQARNTASNDAERQAALAREASKSASRAAIERTTQEQAASKPKEDVYKAWQQAPWWQKAASVPGMIFGGF